jgi:hypothetical protein
MARLPYSLLHPANEFQTFIPILRVKANSLRQPFGPFDISDAFATTLKRQVVHLAIAVLPDRSPPPNPAFASANGYLDTI